MSSNINSNQQDDSPTLFSKYFRMFVFTMPINNFLNYSNGLDNIFDELAKTKLPKTTEFISEIQKEIQLQYLKIGLASSLTFWAVFRFKKLSILNKLFISGMLSSGFFMYFSLQMKERILNYLIQSQTHYGQESRILTKFFIPDHQRILSIQTNIEDFRLYIKDKKKLIDLQKSNLEKLIKEEKELDSIFIKEIADEMEKQEKQQNLSKKK